MEPRRSAGDAVPRRRLASVQQRGPAGPSSGVFDTSGTAMDGDIAFKREEGCEYRKHFSHIFGELQAEMRKSLNSADHAVSRSFTSECGFCGRLCCLIPFCCLPLS